MKDKDTLPLSKQPAYQAIVKNLNDISAKLAENATRLEACRTRLLAETEKAAAPSAINQALAIVRGESLSIRTTREEITALEEEQRVLRAGYMEICAERDRVESELSREAGQSFQRRHIEAVKAVQQAVIALTEANMAEEQIRSELQRLGYHAHGLPNMGFSQVGDPTDRNGTPSYYYIKESSRYIDRW